MTLDTAIAMLEARLKCIKRSQKTFTGCNFRCAECALEAAKGNLKEQQECLEMAILILKHRPKLISIDESYIKGYNRCRIDMCVALAEIDNYTNVDIYTNEVREIVSGLHAEHHIDGGEIDVLLDHFKSK